MKPLREAAAGLMLIPAAFLTIVFTTTFLIFLGCLEMALSIVRAMPQSVIKSSVEDAILSGADAPIEDQI